MPWQDRWWRAIIAVPAVSSTEAFWYLVMAGLAWFVFYVLRPSRFAHRKIVPKIPNRWQMGREVLFSLRSLLAFGVMGSLVAYAGYSGYTRFYLRIERYGSPSVDPNNSSESNQDAQSDPFKKQGNQFAHADLVSDLSWMTRNANRANVTMYTIDPRGLVGMPDLDEKIDMVEWQNYVRTSQDSLRTIAELTGGYAAVNQNDFAKALQRIDAETSDYYVVGYYSNNPDPRKRNRNIEIKTTRNGLDVMHRKAYTLKER